MSQSIINNCFIHSNIIHLGVEYMDRTSITSLENNKEGVNLELLTRTGEEENNNSSAFQHNEPLSEHVSYNNNTN